MSLWKVFMQDLRFLDFYMSNDTNSKLKLWKLAKFWAVWILVVRTVREWTKRRILTAELIMSYKGISLVDHIHLGAYEMFELDIYARVACYKMFEWIKCLVFKIELIWMDMIMRWHLVCDIIEYMSCESIQTSWHQVWFNLMKYSSIAQNLSFIENLSKLRR